MGYLAAVLIELAAVGLTLLAGRLLPLFAVQGALIILGIVLVALTWGAGPSLLAVLVGTMLLRLVVMPLYLPWLVDAAVDGICLAVALLAGSSISLLASQSAWARRQAQELVCSLREEQTRAELERQRLRMLLDVLPAAVGMLDVQARVLETNPASKVLWGEGAPDRGEMAQVQTWRGWSGDTGKPLDPEEWAITRALTKGKTTINQEVEVEMTDGQRKVILDSAVPICDEQGTTLGAVGIHQDITERKQLEEALRASERRAAAQAAELEAIFEAMTDGLLLYDAEGRILRYNRAASQFLGFEAHPEFASLSWKERAVRYAPLDDGGQPILPEDLALSRLLRGEVLIGSQAAEDSLHTPDGRKVAFSMTGRPLCDAEGVVIGAVGIARDVTERRRMEREVADHAARLETIFESIADGVIVVDHQGRMLHMNQTTRTLLGIEQDPTGLTMPELEDRWGFSARNLQGQLFTHAERPLNRYLQGEVLTRQRSVDLIVQTRDGCQTQLNNTGAPIRDAAGQIIGAVEVFRDVTEQRRLEQHTRDTLDALLAMAEALVQVSDQTPTAGAEAASIRHPAAQHLAELTRKVLGCQQVSIVAVEPATEAMIPITLVGLAPEQEQAWWCDLKEHPRMAQRLHPDVVTTLHAGEPVLLERLQPPLSLWQRLTPTRASLLVPMRIGETLVGLLRIDCSKVGEEYTCSDRQALVSAVARLGALVLERERLLREREEAQAREMVLRETSAQMDVFLGMAGHELKTPLTSIKLALQLVERRSQRLFQSKPDIASALAPVQDHVARAEHQADRLDRLVNDLLDVSRVRAGKLEFHLEPADLASIVREAVDEQRLAAPDRSILLQFPADFRAPLLADADRLGQVVTNYLTNALKYSPADCPVEVGIQIDGQQARVWVRDEGPGLPPEEQERIWDRFHRVDGIKVQSGSGVGLGLGLHICRTIVER
ncbi:MAG TPA: PAS domain S-box protein, partial [Ktedonobacterales bacterium]|nr:PAS domain S-box protein [Ktedonobacterales bacterium]